MRAGDGWLNFLPPLPPAALWSAPRSLPFPFDDPRCRVYDYGRNALWHGLQALGLGEGDEVLMPAYHCGSEVAAVVDLGIVARFWAGEETLAPDEDELERLVSPRTRALYLTHHLGLAQDAPRWRRWCDQRDLLLLEDVAPGWPAALDGRPLGSWGHLSIYSPWKTFGLPDCGAVLCDPPPPRLAESPRAPSRDLVRGFLRWPLQRSSLAARYKGARREESFDASVAFEIREPGREVSRASMGLLRRLARPGLAATRARNYDWLRERLGGRVAEPFRRPAAAGCPFGLPLVSEDKPGLLRHLAERGISGLDFWSVPHPAVRRGAFPAVDRLRETIVVLPVHQQLRQRDLDRLARAALEWPGGGA
jgi:dTDP-4-amino-4,6-dideoxygalactose transaminase